MPRGNKEVATRKPQARFHMGGEEEPLSLVSKNGKVKVSFSNLGEGYSGDYDEDDPQDVNLLRFDVYRKIHARTWEFVDDASYCTLMPAGTNMAILKEALRHIMDFVEDSVTDGYSIKKVCERLSWIKPEWFVKKEHAGLTIKPQNT